MRGEVSQERQVFKTWEPKPSGNVTTMPWGNPSLMGEAQLLPTGSFVFQVGDSPRGHGGACDTQTPVTSSVEP